MTRSRPSPIFARFRHPERGPLALRLYYGVRIPIREYIDNRKDRT